MKQSLVIHVFPQAQEAACAWCGRLVDAAAGPQLALPETLALVCGDCGRARAPVLAALIELAGVAGRVGAIVRRNQYWIPLKAQLDVVHAAEGFSQALEADARSTQLAVRLRGEALGAVHAAPAPPQGRARQ